QAPRKRAPGTGDGAARRRRGTARPRRGRAGGRRAGLGPAVRRRVPDLPEGRYLRRLVGDPAHAHRLDDPRPLTPPPDPPGGSGGRRPADQTTREKWTSN